ncbi:MurR/RpiR family transcriptional regulator [Brevibacterium litoralis]|uniref:MurR/RpiR family transcriptional regulator n=1 Tax=Brevibacterium litoralis TaxID=3138935 RepID=UPI0032EADED5
MTTAEADPAELPDAGGVLDRIRSLLPSLVPSEQRVAQCVADDPEGVLDLSAAAMAARTGTSAATVSRACKNLGFQGYQHLRLLLARDIGSRRAQASAPVESGDAGIVHATYDSASRALAEAVGTLDVAAFSRAADLVAAAPRLLVIGTGGSAPLAQGVAVRFVASELLCEAPADAVLQLFAANSLRSGDVCLVISESGSNSVTLEAARGAKAAGAAVVGLTAFGRTPLTDLADVALVAGATYNQWQEDRVGGNIVQILLLGALHSAVMDRLRGTTRNSDRFIATVATVTSDDESGAVGAEDGDRPSGE